MNYTPLWIKTDYSILSSLIKIDDLIDRLISLNIDACAICDDNLFYVMEFYTKCKKNNIKPIIGLELNLDETILLYAKNYSGYQNLCKIDTFKNKNELTKEKLYTLLEDLVIVIPYEFKDLTDDFSKYSSDIYIGYSNEENFDEVSYLTNLCVFGLKKRLGDNVTSTYTKRLKYELDIISKMGFCNYFLVVWDYVKYAKKNNILVGPGRGSAASSLVSFCLGITNIDPIKYDLLFERFLNPKRITMPDIDIDFDADKRNEVINYVVDKYGLEKVCGIITFSNLLAKQVIRDLARIFEISNYKIDNLLSNFDDKKNLKEQLENNVIKNILKQDEQLRKLYDVAIHLEGLKRHTSIHAAGIIISNHELYSYVPLALNNDGTYLCGYTMNYIEDLGLLKMDFLGLKNLSIIDRILSRVKTLDINDIPLDDKKTFDLFCNGNLDGVFQFESAGMKKFIIDLKPDNINDLIAAVALFRPGPIDNIPLYVARKQGKEKIDYIHDDLKDILSSTYGIIIYQEQIMQIVSKMAGFSYGEADILRRAMSKKKEDVMLLYKEKFIEGSIKNGYDKKISEKVYNLILKFANYGFNKAHSVSYAILGYKIAYLKANYPLYFMCEILNNYIGVQNKTKTVINECKKLKVEIVKPSINISTCKYEIIEEKLVYPLSMVKGIGTLTARNIIEEREKNGSFTSYIDFVKRTYKLGKDVIRNMILSGALDIFGYNRKTMIENMESVINYADLCHDLDETLVARPEIKEYLEYESEELTKKEIELFGFYIDNHPTNKFITDESITTDKLDKYFDKYIDIVLYFENKRQIDTKNKEKMMFINASDSFGNIDLILFPNVYNKYFNIIVPGVYVVKGKVEKRFSKLQIIVNEINKKE